MLGWQLYCQKVAMVRLLPQRVACVGGNFALPELTGRHKGFLDNAGEDGGMRTVTSGSIVGVLSAAGIRSQKSVLGVITMKRLFCTIALTLGVAALMGLSTANADLAQKDSSAFNWKYEMDPRPDNQDLDLNSTPDFRMSGSDYSFTGGVLTIGGAGLASDQAGQIMQAQMTYAAGFTAEVRLKVLTSTGSNGALTMDPAVGYGDFYSFGSNQTLWGSSVGGTAKQVLDSNDNSDAYHVFRLAQLPNTNSFSAWRDGVLLGSGLVGGFDFGGAYFRLGNEGSVWAGTAEVDYLRLTSGAWAPVPEPSTLTLLVAGLFGLLAYAWRRRK